MNRITKINRKTKNSLFFRLAAMMILMTTGFTASGQNEFITTWQATGGTITIPTTGGGYNYDVYWEEIGNVAVNGTSTGRTGNYTISGLNSTHQYRVKISGAFPRIYFNDSGDKNKILTVEQWGDIAWTDMTNAFLGCSNLTIPAADAPDLSGVTSLKDMFKFATNLAVDHIDLWDVSHIQLMNGLFFNCRNFNNAIGGWDVSHVTNMGDMFRGASAFNQQIGNWNVSNVTNMNSMFLTATSFNGNIGSWNVGNVTNMGQMFVTAVAFNQDIGNWNVSNVTNMGGMFMNTFFFNRNIGNWDVSNVVDMGEMFRGNTVFNQNIGNWDVGNVTNMGGMFWDASAFNQDLGNWNVSKVTDMNQMFRNAIAFDHNLGNWNITSVTNMDAMFNNSKLSRANYELTLAGWALQSVSPNVPLGASGLEYCDDDGRATLVAKGWDISGDINVDCSFITTWQATDGIITIPTTGGGYNYDIYWEEIGNISNNGAATALTGNYTINTINANQYRVKIIGQFPRIYFNDGTEKNKILTIEQWGNIAWTSMSEAFFGCSNLTVPAADAPDLSGVLSLQNMFKNCTLLTVDHIDLWDVSHVQYMDGMFVSCASFNGNIGGWNVSNVKRFRWMFENATAFNQDIGNWNISNATDMAFMFNQASSFNQNIGNWNVGNVTNMNAMFRNTTSFNQNIGNWNVGNVTSMVEMFMNATAFNQNIGSWDVSNVTAMNGMFRNATSFNQDIGNWNVGNVINMGVMFWNATVFNHNIGNWNVGNVTNMGGMFWDATAFNQDLSNWNVSNVTGMNVMFENAAAFNHNLGNWDVTKVTTMDGIFNNSALSRDNYELTLAGWASKNVLNNVPLGASGLKYCSETARNTLISTKSWSITGDARLCSQTITFNALPAQVYGDIFTLSATASSGLPVTYSSSDPSIASIVDNTVTVHATGNITITATQSGDANNEAANSEQQSLTINPKPVTVSATSGQTKTYGEADPVFTYSVDQPLINGDVFSGSLGRTVGENVGTYSINQHTLTAGSNYTITFVGDDFQITPKEITVTATSGQTKAYGEVDPAFTYSVDQPLINGDAFSGSPGRTVGENVGIYSINQNTLTAGSNYTITFVSDDFQITPKAITVTATSGQTKTYGEADPVFTYSADQPLINGDVFSGSLGRTVGENVGIYSINQHTLTAGSNYTITFVSDDFQITPKAITVTATSNQTKAYGEVDPAFTYSVDQPLINGDAFSGSPGRTVGENVGIYSINQNTLTAGSNYTITFVSDDFQITPKAITVTATSGQTKTYGEADPVFTYSADQPLINGDVFSGSLARIAGENVGAYAIHQNTLTAGNNYVIQFVSADFHILKVDQMITFEPIPDKTVGGDPFTVVATASSALPLSFISSDETVVVISGDQVTIVGAGEVTITAIQAGDDIYNPQEETYTFTVHAGSLFIPTLFSPDGNGVNDLFLVRGTDIEEIHFVVFDMLGNEVYRATDVDTATRRGWDGTKGGVNQPAGTYLWSLRGKLRNGGTLSFEGKSSGQVVLMR